MSEDIAVLEEPLPLIRGDDDWQWFVVFFEDPDGATPLDLSSRSVTAEIRWRGGSQAVAVAVTDAAAGQVTLSLATAETALIPLGKLAAMFIAVGDGGSPESFQTWARCPIEAKEGYSG